MSLINVNQVDPSTGTTLTLGTSGDTVSIPSGVTLSGAGTITPSAVNLAASGAGGVTGTLPIANGGTGATTLAGAGLSNTPAFAASRSSTQAIANNTLTKIQYNNELFDTDSAYDNSTNYRFTAPSAAKYFFYCSVRFATGTYIPDLAPYKNVAQIGWIAGAKGDSQYQSLFASFSLDLASSDYIEIYCRQNSGGSLDIHGGTDTFVLFGGNKLIT